ncbi:hypothetical protein Cni_G27336 [Canna indica]|uniref:ABC transporter domain-containing protein n=1 Tax=Canna indica TaxID=4628 RepID=A0AAQ3QP80_9LILI|nr:hypothetical protein Cni_G27336 [Canna indica]
MSKPVPHLSNIYKSRPDPSRVKIICSLFLYHKSAHFVGTRISQGPIEKKVFMSKNQQNMDDIYGIILKSASVQDHVQKLRKAQSADSIISKVQKDEHGTWFNLRMSQSFGRKVASEESYSTAKRTKSAQHLEATLAPVESGIESSGEGEHVLDFWDGMPSSEVEETSLKNNRPHVKDDPVEVLMNNTENLDPVLWMKMKKEPSFPIYLKFSDVGFKVIANRGQSAVATRPILQGVTGSVEPGEVLALMGPSGGGKTTLLSLLSGRIKIKDHRGSITYNDQPYSNSLKRRIGFVLQDDIVFPHLTVRETLTYSALLRLPKTLTKQQKEERAMKVIFDLGLERCQDTIIGGAYIRGISGGERKRVCIGNEILLDPSLLFLDEPTSGLDSTTALRITKMLHNIAHVGKTVVTTVHQPSSRLFNMFDKLILLGKGTSIYFGKASEAMLYFSSIGYNPLIPMNPAEFLIDLANGNINEKSIPLELEHGFLKENEEISHHLGRPSSMDIQEVC